MSIALERLSPAERQVIAESLLTDPRPHKNGELTAHCPFHQERTPGGSFFYNYDQDLAFCFSCQANYDLVAIFNAVQGREPADAEGCRQFVQKYCPADGRRPVPAPPRKPVQKQWEASPFAAPPALWVKRAEAFVGHASARLLDSEKRLGELEAWGISAETARLCRLGWNDKDKWPPCSAWGLPETVNQAGRPKKVWLPEGLVLPAVRAGKVIKIKVRRPDPTTPWGEQRKYWEVVGGSNGAYSAYGQAGHRIWVLVETERDAVLIWQECRGLGVGAMGTGGAAKRPDGRAAAILRRAAVVLNAMDYDQAGAAATYKFWENEFPNAKRWPAPPSLGKDVGDAFLAGLDIRQWVLDGLPGYAKRFLEQNAPPPQKDQNAPQAQNMQSGEGPKKPHFEQVLEWMAPWPLWRQELLSFYEALQGTGFRVFMKLDGSVWMGLKDGDWRRLHADKEQCVRFVKMRAKLHNKRELDVDLGVNSLEKIIKHYFGDHLEKR